MKKIAILTAFSDHDKELKMLEEASKLNPYDDETLLWLGERYMEGNNREQEAYECFKQVCKLKPNHGCAIYNMGACCYFQKKYEEALKYYFQSRSMKRLNL
jgi:tetratricopeptide (TPR) repeat protein